MATTPRSGDHGVARELPEHLRQWDGRPSQFHEHRLAYLAAAPLPPELKTKSPRRTSPDRRSASGSQKGASKKRPGHAKAKQVNREALEELLHPAEASDALTADDVNAILGFVVRAHPKDGRLLETLQDETHKVLARSANARKKREAAKQREANGAAEEEDQNDGEQQPAEHDAKANDEPQTARKKSPAHKAAPPSSSEIANGDRRNPRGKRYQPPLTKPRPVQVGPDGSVDFMPGIDDGIRYNMGRPKLPKARVMTLPWNTALLPEEEQEKVRAREAKREQRRDREELWNAEATGRSAILRDERQLRRKIGGVAADERETIAEAERKKARRAELARQRREEKEASVRRKDGDTSAKGTGNGASSDKEQTSSGDQQHADSQEQEPNNEAEASQQAPAEETGDQPAEGDEPSTEQNAADDETQQQPAASSSEQPAETDADGADGAEDGTAAADDGVEVGEDDAEPQQDEDVEPAAPPPAGDDAEAASPAPKQAEEDDA